MHPLVLQTKSQNLEIYLYENLSSKFINHLSKFIFISDILPLVQNSCQFSYFHID